MQNLEWRCDGQSRRHRRPLPWNSLGPGKELDRLTWREYVRVIFLISKGLFMYGLSIKQSVTLCFWKRLLRCLKSTWKGVWLLFCKNVIVLCVFTPQTKYEFICSTMYRNWLRNGWWKISGWKLVNHTTGVNEKSLQICCGRMEHPWTSTFIWLYAGWGWV